MQSNRRNSLEAFFKPGAVAIFGSLREWGGLGRGVIQNLFDFGFEGQIYPINLSYSEVMGLKVYPAVNDVEDSIDLAVVITPPTTVPGIIEQCAGKGIKAAVVVSENFAEADEDGARLQAQLSDIALRLGIRIMGPNTVGILNTANGLVTIPYLVGYEGVQKGSVGYCSQSGIAAAQCQPLEDRGYPVSKMCDIGNKCDVDEVDIMNYMAEDPETKALAMHLEDIKDGRRFMDAARNLASRKPLLIFKSGRSEAGARASASHTGSLKGNDRIYSDAFRQAGAMRLYSWQEFWDIPKVFASRPLPKGNGIAIITHSGGAGVVAADVAAEAGLTVPNFSSSTLSKLTELSPRLARNPIDMGPVLATFDDPFAVQEEIMAAVLSDENIDCASIALYVGVLSPIQPLLEMFDRMMENISKPVAIWIYGPRLFSVAEMSRHLEARGLPTYFELETAVRALGMAARYAKVRMNLNNDAV